MHFLVLLRSLPLVPVLLTFLPGSTHAQTLPQRDSTEFAQYRDGQSYEAVTLPVDDSTIPKWNQKGKAGTAEIRDDSLLLSVPSGEGPHSYTYSLKDVATSVAEGMTLEFRVRVVSRGTDPVRATIQFMSKFGKKEMGLELAPDRYWTTLHGRDRKDVEADLTSFRTFRLASLPEGYAVWVDGERVPGNFPSDTVDEEHDMMLLFGMIGYKAAGVAEIDYIRWDVTGSYAPKDKP